MPVLGYHFGLNPSDVWNLTLSEWSAYQKAIDLIEKASK